MKNIEWSELPSTVQKNLDIECGYSDNGVLTAEWLKRMQKCVEPYNATYDGEDDIFYFESEARYNWFLLRWS